ncbi:hypothetical protein NFI96_001694 [Prochilodus magdalenae]|nr:hypothetical protein NFI96_001694 [Prochilodus magdalenae]
MFTPVPLTALKTVYLKKGKPRKAKSVTRDGCRINSALLQRIKAQQGETVDFSALDWPEKCEILRSNPVTTLRMFEKRVEALMNLIQSPAQPIGEHEMSDYLKRVMKEMCPNSSERETMKQVMKAYSKNREVSAQEAVARTCSLKLKSSSRAVIFIPTHDNAVIKSPEECPPDALHIFATNKEVDDFNSAAITSRFLDIINIDAEDYKKDPRSGQMQREGAPFKGEKGDLIDTLQVAVGARVMLTRNIDVEDGLVNGSFGKVAKIIMKACNTVVQNIGLKLDNADAGKKQGNRVPSGSDNVVYIEREEESLRKKGTVRRQFPIKLAFACTTHKVQGMTTRSAVVSLKKVFEPGMAYVAVSRTTSLSGLHITDFDEKKIYCDPEISAALEIMPKADLHAIQPLLHIHGKWNNPVVIPPPRLHIPAELGARVLRFMAGCQHAVTNRSRAVREAPSISPPPATSHDSFVEKTVSPLKHLNSVVVCEIGKEEEEIKGGLDDWAAGQCLDD